jgi:molybdopterin converting factor small subunit
LKVRVVYLSLLRDATGKRDEEIEIPPDSTVSTLISVLMEKYGDKIKPFLDPGSDINEGIILSLNGELLSPSDMGKKISENAEFMVGLPPFGG